MRKEKEVRREIVGKEVVCHLHKYSDPRVFPSSPHTHHKPSKGSLRLLQMLFSIRGNKRKSFSQQTVEDWTGKTRGRLFWAGLLQECSYPTYVKYGKV